MDAPWSSRTLRPVNLTELHANASGTVSPPRHFRVVPYISEIACGRSKMRESSIEMSNIGISNSLWFRAAWKRRKDRALRSSVTQVSQPTSLGTCYPGMSATFRKSPRQSVLYWESLAATVLIYDVGSMKTYVKNSCEIWRNEVMTFQDDTYNRSSRTV